MIWAVVVAGSYLVGSFSSSYLLVRTLHHVDVRDVGSGNAGATNVLRVSGTVPALVVLVLDMAKGAVGVVVAGVLGAPGLVIGGAAVAAVLGHIFPVFHGFRGGKGVATATGALVWLAPIPAAMAVLVFLLTTLVTRYVSVGSMASVTLLPPLVYLSAQAGWTEEAPAWLLLTTAVIAALIVLKHHDNIRRLRDGEELKLGELRRREEVV